MARKINAKSSDILYSKFSEEKNAKQCEHQDIFFLFKNID